ncbi:hypothetical protein [Nostoc sp.]
MFEKSNLLLALATGSRTPGASSRETRPTHWLGYTDKTHRPGLKTLIFHAFHGGGLDLCSSEFYDSVGELRRRSPP